MNSPIVVAYGGGTNSTALLVGLHERGIRPNLILFADTGGEKPWTYEHIETVSQWCLSVEFPSITVVKATNETLEQSILKNKALPSIAYGWKTCSQRFKIEPQSKYLRSIGMKNAIRYVGIDAGEQHRAKEYELTRYPLIEWGWGRDECIAAIARAGLPQPGKSACFFCPSSRPSEILALPEDLLQRALAIEANADLTHVKGLGRNWSWRDLVRSDRAQMDMFKTVQETPCGCYDGGDDD